MIKEKFNVLKIANVYGNFVFAMGNIGMEQILDTMMDVKMVWMNFIVMVSSNYTFWKFLHLTKLASILYFFMPVICFALQIMKI